MIRHEADPAAASQLEEPAAEVLAQLERGLAQLLRWMEDRETLGDLAHRSGHALAPASWALLEHLAARGSMRVSDVAACHGVHPSSIIPRLKALEQTGLVDRGADAADARVSIISITTAGRDALDSIHAARQEALGAVLPGMDSVAIETAADVLASIAQRLSESPVARRSSLEGP